MEIVIREGLATSTIGQIFKNHTFVDQEGIYEFLIPEQAAISRFAIWEGLVRLPGVVLEKKRAEQLYESLTWRKKDPGLLQQAEEARKQVFSVKVFPIPALGTKRLELAYCETIGLDRLSRQYRLPLKPARYRTQTAGDFSLKIKLESQLPLVDVTFPAAVFPLRDIRQSPDEFSGSFQAKNFSLTDDFTLQWRVKVNRMGFSFLTFRDPDTRHQVVPIFSSGRPVADPDGYFLAQVVTSLGEDSVAKKWPERLVVLFDLSLSMRWEKLDRAYEMLEGLLRGLPASTTCLLATFNDRVNFFSDSFLPVTRTRSDEMLAWLGESYQAGGTDLAGALRKVFPCFEKGSGPGCLVVISDGQATLGELRSVVIAKQVAETYRQTGVRIHCCAIGEEANLRLLEELGRLTDGSCLWVSETEDTNYKTGVLLGRLQQQMVEDARISFRHPVNRVYPVSPQRFLDGSFMSIVGRYASASSSSQAKIRVKYQGKELAWSPVVSFPERDLRYEEIPRVWARARIEELLRLIHLQGEKEEWIEEIISLAKQYNLVTPYTSFLAAPRSLLRPRAIKPGDPVLRVRTRREVVQVVAIFPFGEVKTLHYSRRKDLWETRFLVPPGTRDGQYSCRLVLVDNAGRQWTEEKSFLVDSQPPRVRLILSGRRVRPGDTIEIRALADADTRSLRAKFPGLAPVGLYYRR
ncbi:MAG TPA: VIT domain-containing protein, partial [bacterium]|nr:VIT domain-containing protein [bacterium]